MATNFFNMCFNFEKYWEFEQDASCKVIVATLKVRICNLFPTNNQNNGDDTYNSLSDWEKYAQEQYRTLAAEEQANDE